MTPHPITRRQVLTACSMSLGGTAVYGLLHEEAMAEQRASYNLKPRAPHFQSRAKAVIQLF